MPPTGSSSATRRYRKKRKASESTGVEEEAVSNSKKHLASNDDVEEGEVSGDGADADEDRSRELQASLIERQEQEILSLKRRLEEREAYANDTIEADNQRLTSLESKMDQMLSMMTKGSSKQEEKPDFSVQFLHTKVDKCIRMILEVSENLQKTQKFIKQLQRTEEKTEKEEVNKAQATRFSTAGALKSINKAAETSPSSRKEEIKGKDPEKPKPPDPNEQHKWGKNMLLVGDGFWGSFSKLEDIKNTVDVMTNSVGFRIGTVRENCMINDLFDSREMLKFPLPNRFKTVGISVGSFDLLTDKNLMTLADGPFAEVKKNNASVLSKKAHIVRKMVDKLLGMDRNVVLLVPPFGKHRREIFQQWRDMVVQHCDDLMLPSFRILDLCNLM